MSLVDHLTVKDDFYARAMPSPDEWRYRSFENWVLSDEGRSWTAADVRPYPDFKGSPKNCFEDAIVLAFQNGWRYVEGFATGAYGLDVHHAWCLDDDGRVVDPAWEAVAESHAGPFPADHLEYRGIVFDRFDAGRWMDAKGEYGLFYGAGSERIMAEGRAAVESGAWAEQTVAEKGLTGPQKRYLAEIRATPGRRYNGRARRPLEALQAAGLIEVDYDQQPHADVHGNIKTISEVFICRPVVP